MYVNKNYKNRLKTHAAMFGQLFSHDFRRCYMNFYIPQHPINIEAYYVKPTKRREK